VKPSAYTVEVTREGFKKIAREHVEVNVAESVSLALTLELGSVSETVEVSGAAPLLQTERGELGQVVDRQQLLDLPLNGRDAISLAGLTSGVVPGPQFSDGPLNLANFSIDGSRGGATEILVDGAPDTAPENSPGGYVAATLPSMERVQEFKVQTNAFSAEFGRSTGGIINIVVKSGTNDVHGSAYEFLRNSVTDANDFFLNRAGRKLATFQRNQFGFTLGGPVLIPRLYNGRNRTFVFGGYEGVRQRSLSTSTVTLPSATEAAGDFSQTLNAPGQPLIIYDPITTTAAAGGGYVRTPFPGNRIPADRIDPVAVRLLSFYPKPDTPGTGPARINNYTASGASQLNDDNFDVRVDQIISETQNFYVRLSNRDYRTVSPNFYGTIGQSGPQYVSRPGQSAAVHYSRNFGPHLLWESTYGYAGLFTTRQSFSYGTDITKELGLPSALAQISSADGFPSITINGYGAIGEAFKARFRLESHSFQESLTFLTGKQSIKFGVQFRISRTNFYQGQAPAGQFSFTQAFTQGPDPTRATATGGNGLASFLLGYAATGSVTHDAYASTQSPYWGPFVQDDIKLTRTLTLNLGLRYELEIPRSERYNRLSVFDPTIANPIGAQVPGYGNLKGALLFLGKDRDKQFNTDKNNFGPRFGFAWRAPREFVARGGYAIFYSAGSTTAGGTLGGIGDAGFSSSTPFLSSLDGGLTPASRLSNPFPNGFSLPPGSSQGLLTFLGQDFDTPNLYDRTTYVQQWNFNIQKEALRGTLVEVGYAGSKGTHLPIIFGAMNQLTDATLALGPSLLNQVPNPFYGVITNPVSLLSQRTVQMAQLLRPYAQFTTMTMDKASIASSIYHSLQVRVDHRFRRGVSFLGAYTWSKSIDDVSSSSTGLNGPQVYTQDWFNRRADRSLSVFDVPSRLVLSGTYELPIGRSKLLGRAMNRVEDAFLGGWQVNGIYVFARGLPLVLTNSVNTCNCLNQLNGAAAPVNGTQRPNNSGTSAARSGAVVDRLNQYFTTSVFSQPAPFTYGNVGRTLPDVRQPASKNLDFSLFKNFKINEHKTLQFRAEAFNATNTPIFGAPGTAFGASNFGVIASSGNTPRQLQFGLRLAF
jgi:hypothetical protein